MLIAAHIVVALQSIVARHTDPLDSAVVTVGKITSGTASNIIPQTATLVGTVRALNEDTRQQTLQHVRRIATHTAESFGGRADVQIEKDGYPPMVNDHRARALAESVVDEALKDEIRPFELEQPIMGAEDFAFYSQQVPAFIFGLGLRRPDAESHPLLHQPDFDFNDQALPFGIKMHVEIARRFAGKWQG